MPESVKSFFTPQNVISIVQIILAVLLVASILLQTRGQELGTLFGGTGGEAFRSRRGLERVLHYVTIVLAILFAVTALLGMKVST